MYASPKLTQKKDKSTEANESEHSKQQDSGKENETSLKLES